MIFFQLTNKFQIPSFLFKWRMALNRNTIWSWKLSLIVIEYLSTKYFNTEICRHWKKDIISLQGCPSIFYDQGTPCNCENYQLNKIVKITMLLRSCIRLINRWKHVEEFSYSFVFRFWIKLWQDLQLMMEDCISKYDFNKFRCLNKSGKLISVHTRCQINTYTKVQLHWNPVNKFIFIFG